MCWLPIGAQEIKFLGYNQNQIIIENRMVVLKMGRIRRNTAGLIFAALGIIFLYLDMAPTMDHVGHVKHMSHETTAHSIKLLGIGEMTWMWFTMALVHFFLNDQGCKHCAGRQ